MFCQAITHLHHRTTFNLGNIYNNCIIQYVDVQLHLPSLTTNDPLRLCVRMAVALLVASGARTLSLMSPDAPSNYNIKGGLASQAAAILSVCTFRKHVAINIVEAIYFFKNEHCYIHTRADEQQYSA